ncbi:MAG TPA: two-component regulator propeller domain-containing protein, partial [Cellvibrionaceae bacterium]|nr:two-component regulator propeller domain-containing protein [Cellvibrionaceae bacterium]
GGELWLGTLNGLGLWQPEQARFTWRGNRALDVRALAQDRQGNLWVGSFNHGLWRVNPDSDEWRSFGKEEGLIGQLIWALEFNQRGELWVASELGGVSRFDPVQERFFASTWHSSIPASLASNKAKALKTDALGDLWVGLFPNGIDHASRFANQFCNYQGADDDRGLSHRSVLSLLPSAQNPADLWVGTEHGLNYFDASTGRFSHFLPEPGVAGRLQSSAILTLAQGERPEEIWVSAWGSGVYRYNSQSRIFRQIPVRPGNAQALQTPYVWAILRAQDGTFYLGGESGGLYIYRGGDLFESLPPVQNDPNSISSGFVRSLLQTRNGRIFVGTPAGLDEYLPEKKAFAHWLRDEQGLFRIGASISVIFESADGQLWLGTEGAGLIRFDPSSHAYRLFTQADGLPSDFIAAINQDKDGVIWLSTLRGIARLKGERFEALDKNLGPVSNNFNRDASLYMPNGQLWFGSAEGLTHFDPLTLMTEAASPGSVHLEALRLLNKPQVIGSSLLPEALDYVPEIVLGSDSPMVSIDFYALNYRAPQLNRFAYKLVGVDADFIDIGNQRSATYTHLPAGRFTFQVKAADSLGQWHPQVKELRIEIKPAWWRSYWAFALYGLIVSLALLALWRTQQRRRDLVQAQALNEKLRQLDQLKDTFLANTSHELRTPLNGIIGLAEALLEGSQGPLSEGVHKTLKIISSSGRRLSYLINDILDFSKLSKRDLQ